MKTHRSARQELSKTRQILLLPRLSSQRNFCTAKGNQRLPVAGAKRLTSEHEIFSPNELNYAFRNPLLGVLLFFSAISLPPDSGHATTSPRVRSATAGNTDRNGEIIRGPRGKFEVALTFDADAKADCFDDLIATLEKAHVHSTFFVSGKWAQQNRVCAEAIPKHGHEIGNHTWNHLDLTKQSDAVVREELVRAEHLINEICRCSPRPLWRAHLVRATLGFCRSPTILVTAVFTGRWTVSIRLNHKRARNS